MEVGGERGTLVECGRLGSAICDCGCQVYWMISAPLIRLALEGYFHVEREDSRHVISRSLVDQRVWPRAVQKVLYCRPNQVTLGRAQWTVKTLARIVILFTSFQYIVTRLGTASAPTPTLPIIEWNVREQAMTPLWARKRAGGRRAAQGLECQGRLLCCSRVAWSGLAFDIIVSGRGDWHCGTHTVRHTRRLGE